MHHNLIRIGIGVYGIILILGYIIIRSVSMKKSISNRDNSNIKKEMIKRINGNDFKKLVYADGEMDIGERKCLFPFMQNKNDETIGLDETVSLDETMDRDETMNLDETIGLDETELLDGGK